MPTTTIACCSLTESSDFVFFTLLRIFVLIFTFAVLKLISLISKLASSPSSSLKALLGETEIG